MNIIVKISLLLVLSLFSTWTMTNWMQPAEQQSLISQVAAFAFFIFIYAILVYELSRHRLSFYEHFSKKSNILFVIIFSLLVLGSTFDTFAHMKGQPFLLQLLTCLGAPFSIAAVVVSMMAILFRKSVPITHQSVSKWRIAGYAILPILGWLLYLLGHFPGEMSPDSFAHWHQIHTLEFDNWHPVVYTWFILFLTNIWFSPAIIGLSQIMIISIIFGYGLYRFEKAGILRPILWVSAVFIALFPIYGAFSIIVWKDVFYSGFILLISVIMFAIYSTKGKWLQSYSHLLLLGLAGLLSMLMRNNGIPIFFALSLLMIIMYFRYWKRLLTTLAVVIASYLFITGPLFTFFEVESIELNEALGIPTQQFARVVTEGGELNYEQRQYIYRMMPEQYWHEHYDPYITDPIKFSGDYESEVVFEDFGYYLRVWGNVVLQNPVITTEAMLKQTSLVWQINEPHDGYTNLNPGGIFRANKYGLTQEPVSDWLHVTLTAFIDYTAEHFNTIFWRPATHMFFILLMGFIAARKTNWRTWLVPAPVILNIGTVFAGIPAQDFRYLLANSFVLVIVFLTALFGNKKKEHRL